MLPMESRVYVVQEAGGAESGVISEAELFQRVRAGRVKPQTLIRDGSSAGGWYPAWRHPALGGLFGSQPAPSDALRRRLPVIGAAAAVVLLLGFVFGLVFPPGGRDRSGLNKRERAAWETAKVCVSRQSGAPSGLQFTAPTTASVVELDEGVYKVDGRLRVVSPAGTVVREAAWSCRVRELMDDSRGCEDIHINPISGN